MEPMALTSTLRATTSRRSNEKRCANLRRGRFAAASPELRGCLPHRAAPGSSVIPLLPRSSVTHPPFLPLTHPNHPAANQAAPLQCYISYNHLSGSTNPTSPSTYSWLFCIGPARKKQPRASSSRRPSSLYKFNTIHVFDLSEIQHFFFSPFFQFLTSQRKSIWFNFPHFLYLFIFILKCNYYYFLFILFMFFFVSCLKFMF